MAFVDLRLFTTVRIERMLHSARDPDMLFNASRKEHLSRCFPAKHDRLSPDLRHRPARRGRRFRLHGRQPPVPSRWQQIPRVRGARFQRDIRKTLPGIFEWRRWWFVPRRRVRPWRFCASA